VPVIYLDYELPHNSSILPSIVIFRTDNPQTMVYMNLQPPDSTACQSLASWWSLTPPSHPCLYGGCFLLHLLLSPTAPIFRSGASYAARTFLL